jgi:basic amino acid/polyamine antiporter, APA family
VLVPLVVDQVELDAVAQQYAEAAAMLPEAGGSSSFARHAFNEFVSFFAAWAQMLNYVITVAISAFLVPHYLGGLFWDPLRSAPGDASSVSPSSSCCRSSTSSASRNPPA